MNAVSLAARKQADFFLLIGAGKIKPSDVSSRVHLSLAELDHIVPAGDFFPDVLVGVERVAPLIDVAQFHRFAGSNDSAVRVFTSGDHPEQSCLTRSVRTDDSDDAAGRKRERHSVDQQIVAVSFADVFRVDDDVAESRPGRYVDLKLTRSLVTLL